MAKISVLGSEELSQSGLSTGGSDLEITFETKRTFELLGEEEGPIMRHVTFLATVGKEQFRKTKKLSALFMECTTGSICGTRSTIKTNPNHATKNRFKKVKANSKTTVKTNSQDSIKTNSKNTIEANHQETIKVIPKDNIETNPEDSVNTRPEDTVETNPKDAIKTSPKDVIDTNPKDTIETNPKDDMKPNPKKKLQVLQWKNKSKRSHPHSEVKMSKKTIPGRENPGLIRQRLMDARKDKSLFEKFAEAAKPKNDNTQVGVQEGRDETSSDDPTESYSQNKLFLIPIRSEDTREDSYDRPSGNRSDSPIILYSLHDPEDSVQHISEDQDEENEIIDLTSYCEESRDFDGFNSNGQDPPGVSSFSTHDESSTSRYHVSSPSTDKTISMSPRDPDQVLNHQTGEMKSGQNESTHTPHSLLSNGEEKSIEPPSSFRGMWPNPFLMGSLLSNDSILSQN